MTYHTKLQYSKISLSNYVTHNFLSVYYLIVHRNIGIVQNIETSFCVALLSKLNGKQDISPLIKNVVIEKQFSRSIACKRIGIKFQLGGMSLARSLLCVQKTSCETENRQRACRQWGFPRQYDDCAKRLYFWRSEPTSHPIWLDWHIKAKYKNSLESF